MNDSGESQDVESTCIGKLSHVPSQPAVVPSPRGVLSRDQSLRPDTRNMLGTSGNFIDSPLAPIGSSSTLRRGMLHSWNLNVTTNEKETLYQRRDSRGDRQPGILSLQQKEVVLRITWLINKKLQISEVYFVTDFPHLQPFSCWRTRFKTQGNGCSGSPSEATLWIKEVEMVDSVDDFKNTATNRGPRISRILKCWTRELLLLCKRSSRIPTSRKRSVWRNRKLRRKIGFFAEDRSLT